jgi:hypothetical protein
MRNLREILKNALSIGALLGNMEGGSYTGNFERKVICISCFLFFEPVDIKS